MKNREQITATLTTFFINEFLDGNGEDFDNNTPLLELGLVDSFSITLILDFIKKNFDTNIPIAETTPKNLKSINTITDLILKLSNQ